VRRRTNTRTSYQQTTQDPDDAHDQDQQLAAATNVPYATTRQDQEKFETQNEQEMVIAVVAVVVVAMERERESM
jgi:hypothetical protein